MPVAAGTRIGPYEVLSPLGAGGMGEVYRAKDQALGRDVALKLLAPGIANDATYIARFQREAQILASLNHPTIAVIHGIQDNAIVMELVPGETLADKIARGPIPLEEALPIARQIVDALDAAHQRGIVHRDLKPANVKITPEGGVKVLDFGLAVAAESASASVAANATLTIRHTGVGQIVGTTAYMSPEQARGKPVDKRADIWSFGATLYEMLSGRTAFGGETVSDTVAAVLKTEPDWSALPDGTPGRIRELLTWCLNKDPHKRLRDIADAARFLEIPPDSRAAVRSKRWPYVVALLVLAATAAVAIWNWYRAVTERPTPVVRFSVPIPKAHTAFGILALSPDGRTLAYAAEDGGTSRLYVRKLESTAPVALPGTEDSYSPFFSPDGQWLGFFTIDKLKKAPLNGGPAVTICSVAMGRGGSWNQDGQIIFGRSSGGLAIVSASGGTPRSLTTPDTTQGHGSHRWPQLLPGGKTVLYTSGAGPSSALGALRVETVTLSTGERKVLLDSATYARYVPTGHLVYGQGGVLMAAQFDVQRAAITGSPIPMLDKVRMRLGSGIADYAVSESGTLVYLLDESHSDRHISVVSRNGETRRLQAPPRGYSGLRLSPDETRLAVTIGTPSLDQDIWIYHLQRGTLTRLTFDNGGYAPIWTPDGSRIIYGHWKDKYRILMMPADGSSQPEVLADNTTHLARPAWTDGERLVLSARTSSFGIWMLPLKGNRRAVALGSPPLTGVAPAIAGSWLAYMSNESGLPQIYVRRFPSLEGKWQASTDGGSNPRWSRSGGELFYRNDDRVMAVAVEGGEVLRLGTPKVAFALNRIAIPDTTGPRTDLWDVSPDGMRAYVIQDAVEVTTSTEANVVMGWFQELTSRVPR